MKTLIKVFALLFAVLSLNSCLVGKFMCNYVLVDMPDGKNIERTRYKADSLLAGSTAWAHDGDHTYSPNGICTIDGCIDQYQPATLNSGV